MTLVKIKDIFAHAEENQYDVGAFSVANIEMVNVQAPFKDYFSYHDSVIKAAGENVKRHMEMFQSVGRVKGDKAYV